MASSLTNTTNKNRAQRVAPFIEEYFERYEGAGEDIITAAQDLISDVLHYLSQLPADQLVDQPLNDEGCDECRVGPGRPCLDVYAAVLEEARANFEAEIEEDSNA